MGGWDITGTVDTNQQKGACEADLEKQAPRGSLASEDVIKHIVLIWSVCVASRKKV